MLILPLKMFVAKSQCFNIFFVSSSHQGFSFCGLGIIDCFKKSRVLKDALNHVDNQMTVEFKRLSLYSDSFMH